MIDIYRNYRELRSKEISSSFSIVSRSKSYDILILVPHGGGIEPGTSELGHAIAGHQYSLYLFIGAKSSGNRTLHITSSNFDEPEALRAVDAHKRVVAIHGCGGQEPIVFVGGKDRELGNKIIKELNRSGIKALRPGKKSLQGLDKQNICNRDQLGAGVQLELAEGLRSKMFRDLTKLGREHRTKLFRLFVEAIRKVLNNQLDQHGT
jgi:phage replication-related protein YjqB (UPF0714/DUF867 family)